MKEEEKKKVDEGEGESDKVSANGDGSRMDEEDDNDTLENAEQALEHTVRTKVVARTAACSQLQAINKLAAGFQELA